MGYSAHELHELSEKRAAKAFTEGIGWWDGSPESQLPEEEVEKIRALSLLDSARNLENLQREVHEQNLYSAQLYSNRELAAFDWGNSAMYRTSLAPVSRTGENLVLMVVDTLVSQIGKNRPKARPQTRGSSWTLRQQAKLLDKFLYGEFIRTRVYEKGKHCFRDACIFGFGAMYVCADGEGEDAKVHLERVFPDELIVDQMEVVACGKARHWYRRRVLPIEVVCAMYGMERAEFEKSAVVEYDLDWRHVGKGHVVLVEGWQCARGSKSGRYVAAVGEHLLKDKPYKLEEAPFVIYQWQPPLSGFYSGSAVEQALPYQIRLNEINDVIRDAQDLMGRPRILVAEGSRVNPLEIDNISARFIKYTGIAPEAVTWPAINAEIYNERDRQVRICLEQFGISALASKVTPPTQARFDSSPAFREFNAIQDDRLADPAQRFERFYLDIAEMIIRVIRSEGMNPKTVWISGGESQIEVIEWDQIDLDENAYVLQLEATSIFDSSPAAIRDELEKQLGMGLITPEEYRLQLSHPDDESELSLQAAAAADLRRVISLLEKGEYESPTPIQDLVNGVQLVSLAALNLRQYPDVDPEIHLNFLNWLTEARAILEIGQETPTSMEASEMNPGLALDPMTGQPMDPMAAMTGGQMPQGPAMGGDMGMGMGMGTQGIGPGSVPVPESAGLGGRTNRK